MKVVRLFLYLLFVISLNLASLQSYADCGNPNDMDKECDNSCGKGKGCYLPPVPNADDSKCPNDFPNKTDDKICCCKEKK